MGGGGDRAAGLTRIKLHQKHQQNRAHGRLEVVGGMGGRGRQSSTHCITDSAALTVSD